MFDNIIFEKKDGIAVLTINREASLNSLDGNTSREMHEAVLDFRDDDSLRVMIVTGVGRAFSTGMDLVARNAGDDQFAPGAAPFGGFTTGVTVYKPIIAAINGFCLAGGCEVALACDIRICTAEARFGQPEVRWAIIPGAGGTQRLPRAIPQAWSNYMILTGDQMDAETALRLGLVSHIVPREELMEKAMQIATTICERGPLAVQAAKEAILRGQDMPLEHGLALERLLIGKMFATEDAVEGPKAFAEKRKPVYNGS
jgi:enoyl-CoA hydratase/carnithine racemase